MTKDAWRQRMVAQMAERRETGRGLRPGDIVQSDVGGPYLVIVQAQSAGEAIEARVVRDIAGKTSEGESQI